MAGDRKEPGTEITLMTGERLFIPDSLRKLYSNYGYEYEDDRAKEAVLIPWHNIKRITTYLG